MTPKDVALSPRPAIFLDRDGTILDELGYLADPAAMRFLPGALAALATLAATGLPLVVITNQSGIARGLLDQGTLARIHGRMQAAIQDAGSSIDGFYHCPHHPEIGDAAHRRVCDCRKPAPGMLLRAAAELALDLSTSFAVGDTARDLEAARRAGVPHRLLVRTGKGEETWRAQATHLAADGVVPVADLQEAADWIAKVQVK